MTVDDVLFALRLKGWRYEWQSSPRLWHGVCPSCTWPSLTIYDGFEGAKLSCVRKCTEADILAAFSEGLETVNVDEALKLGEDLISVLYRLQGQEGLLA